MKMMMPPASLQRSIQQKHLQLQTIPLYWMKSKKMCTLSRKERSFEALLVLHCSTASVHVSDWLELCAIYVSNNNKPKFAFLFLHFPQFKLISFVRARKSSFWKCARFYKNKTCICSFQEPLHVLSYCSFFLFCIVVFQYYRIHR